MTYRWIGFVLLAAFAAATTSSSYRAKGREASGDQQKPTRFPLLEVAAVTVAAAAWGLGSLGSPILVQVHDNVGGAILIALITFAGAGTNNGTLVVHDKGRHWLTLDLSELDAGMSFSRQAKCTRAGWSVAQLGDVREKFTDLQL